MSRPSSRTKSKIFVFSLLQNYSAASLILHFFGFLALLVQNTRLLTISEPKGCVNYLEHIIHNEYVFEKIICNGTVVHKISKKKPCYYQAIIPKLHLFVDFKALYCMFSYTPKNIQPDHILRTIFYSFLSGILMHYRSIVQSEPKSKRFFSNQ